MEPNKVSQKWLNESQYQATIDALDGLNKDIAVLMSVKEILAESFAQGWKSAISALRTGDFISIKYDLKFNKASNSTNPKSDTRLSEIFNRGKEDK